MIQDTKSDIIIKTNDVKNAKLLFAIDKIIDMMTAAGLIEQLTTTSDFISDDFIPASTDKRHV